MKIAEPYFPHDLFAPSRPDRDVPRVFVAPQRYIQGEGVLDEIGRYISLLDVENVALLMSDRRRSGDGSRLVDSLNAVGITGEIAIFGGECSLLEVGAHVDTLGSNGVQAILAFGGGKCVDAGKAIAHRLSIPVVVAPSLASNDAPCSALSVTYTPEGVADGVEFYPQSPAMVVVDTGIIATAPERFLVSGMGDAMATWCEARVTMANPSARSSIGARPTIASSSIGQACAATIYDYGIEAAAAVAANTVNDSLELVVEANTLLSGLGFESGGLAAAHGVASACTGLPIVHEHYLHGEMVAFGVITQLMMQELADEAAEVASFFVDVGLPIHLGQLSIDPSDDDALSVLIAGTLGFPMLSNMPMAVDGGLVRASLLDAHDLGMSIASDHGDEAYVRLRP